MKRISIILALLISAGTALAAPPEIEAMNNLPNAGQLYIDYCAIGHHGCVTVEAICYGQCCKQGEADSMGYGCSGDIRGIVPPGLHYAGWSCKTFDKGKVTSGEATKNYDHSECHNPR